MRYAAPSWKSAARRPPASARPPARRAGLRRPRSPPSPSLPRRRRRPAPPEPMDLRDRAIALYGRYSHGVRERLERDIEAAGGQVARDLTRRSDVLVIGALATTLIDGGALPARLATARQRGLPVLGERAFLDAIAGDAAKPATLPLATALAD